MGTALVLRSVYADDLEEILKAQQKQGGGEHYIQPLAGRVNRILEKRKPTREAPMRLYVCTTKDGDRINYTADIVQWEDKRQLPASRQQEVMDHLRQHQRNQVKYFSEFDASAKQAFNLITIRSLKRLAQPPATTSLNKVRGGSPLKKPPRAGGWVEVYEIENLA